MLIRFLLIILTAVFFYIMFTSIVFTLDHTLTSRGYYLTDISKVILAGLLCIICGTLCGAIYANSFI